MREGMMADRRSLGIVGLVFGGVTAAVMLIVVFVVKQHVDGRARHMRDVSKARIRCRAPTSDALTWRPRHCMNGLCVGLRSVPA